MHMDALKMRERLHNNLDNFDTANSLQNLGCSYGRLKDYTKALEYHLKALDMRKKICLNDPTLIVTTYNQIGDLYLNIKDFRKALDVKWM